MAADAPKRRRATKPEAAAQSAAALLQEKGIAIGRPAGHQYISVDAAVAAQTLVGVMELSLLTFQNRFVRQRVNISGTEEPVQQITLEEFEGAPFLVEYATLRLTPTAAISMAEVLLLHLRANNLLSEEQAALLRRAAGSEEG